MLTRRWVLGGLVAAPAVLIAGRFMPAPMRVDNWPLIDLNYVHLTISGGDDEPLWGIGVTTIMFPSRSHSNGAAQRRRWGAIRSDPLPT